MRVKIISDSTCDLSPALLERYDIAVTPLCVIKDGKDCVIFTCGIMLEHCLEAVQLLAEQGIDAALVLSGEATLEDLAASEVKPTMIFRDVQEILGYLE